MRQPLYTSRESNTPVGIISSTIKKINVTHNGSSNRDTSSSESTIVEATTSSARIANNPLLKLQQLQQQRNQQKPSAATNPESDSNTSTNLVQSKENDKVPSKQETESEKGDKGDKVYDDELEEYEDEEYENENDAETAAGYEEEGEETDNGTRKIEEKTENKPVILTSNFFLPAATTTPATDAEKPINDETIENDPPVVDSEKSIEIATESDEAQAKPAKEPIVGVTDAGTEKKEKSKETVEKTSLPSADVEYEYEYEYEDETTTPRIVAPTTKSSITGVSPKQENPIEETTAPATDADYYETTTVAPNVSNNGELNQASESEAIPTASPDPNEIDANSTENYVVVASVQTSRSISGARFLPFPQVEQEEKKQSLADLEKDDAEALAENDGEHSVSSDDPAEDLSIYGENNENAAPTLTTARPEETTITSNENASTQEMVTDKLAEIATSPKVHKWSSVSEKLAHLHEKIDNVEVTTKGVPVVIRKFMPRTTKIPHKSDGNSAKVENNNQQTDESSANLPPGFKFRPNSSYKNNKITTTTSTTTSTTTEANTPEPETVQGAPLVEIKNKIQFKEIALEDLLPKDYKPSSETDSSEADDILAKLLPSNFKKSVQSTTKSSVRLSTVTEDVSKFLPPGFKSRESTSKRPISDVTIVDDIGKFLPPGFKLPKSGKSTTTAPKVATILDDISKFLPPGFKVPKSPASDSTTELPKSAFSDDISKFLPGGFKLNATDGESTSSAGSKIKFETPDISSLLPTGFSLNKSAALAEPPSSSPSPSFKIVFPKGIGKRPGSGRVTTPRPAHVEGPAPPGITIRKGLPTR